MDDLNLAGKDFFSEAEAAHYCCVSYNHFRRQVESYGVYPFIWMGKRVYRKADLQRAMEEKACQ